ncbi:MAG: radical SAM protein [Candidatus Omnitrophica bacterium]|nr:radical SAM protein [Candidatus Omnitrophota bacterium]
MPYCFDAKEKFSAILKNVEDKRIPLWAHLDLTYKCNLNCIHCYCQGLSEGFSGSRPELSLEEIKRILGELAEAGSLYLTLSGGEVFLRPDFFEIAEYAKRLRFCSTIFTNGSLVDGKIAKSIADLSPLAVEMSIYGATEDIHDAVTQRKGSFKKLCRAVSLLKKENIKVVLKSVIMKNNFHQAKEIEDFSLQLGANDYHYTMEISPKNDGSRSPQEYQIDDKEIRVLLSENAVPIARGKPDYWDNPLDKPLCATGSLGCYISPYGIIYPCAQLIIPMGDVRKNSFRQIWARDSDLKKELSLLKTYADMPACKSCKYLRSCKKCIGLAYLETKDMKKCYNTIQSISRIDHELSKSRGVI